MIEKRCFLYGMHLFWYIILEYFMPGIVAYTCTPAILETEFLNGKYSIPVGGNNPLISG